MQNSEEIWLSIEEVCSLTEDKKETVRRKCKSGQYKSVFKKDGKFKIYQIALSSLEERLQRRYIAQFKKQNNFAVTTIEYDSSIEEYSNAPLWAKKQADKYIELFRLTDDLSYKEKLAFLNEWNYKNPNKKCSYVRLMEAKRQYLAGGIEALLSKHGHKNIGSKIDDNIFKYFKDVYLREGAPSARTSWQITLGYAMKQGIKVLPNFPAYSSFIRRLKKEVPEQAIYLARYGESAWNKKYACYISRDYSNVLAGSFWVSDHAQIDVAVNFNGNVCFPWVTVFRDVKTSKWLGWFLHAESPNSDHIFQTFYYAVLEYGLPADVYIDNGKDYRCKDFAGGRGTLVKHTSDKENSLLKNLGINVHFAQPYNGQTKPVERDFLKVKTYLSKNMIGYRGGKITERPEKLKTEIKNNEIMQFDDFKKMFDDFIINVLNKMPSKGKVLQGRCPDELWAEEFKVKKVLRKDALKLFCMRTSKNVSIGRNGVYDSQLQITYWDEWMITEKGRKVFIRRDINAYQEAWVFDAETEAYLGKANANQAASFMAKTNIEKAHYKKVLENKNKEKKILKNYIKSKYNPSNEEITENLKIALGKKEFESDVKISRISNTKMDKVVAVDKKKNAKPQTELKTFTVENINQPRIFASETEKKLYEEQMAM
jgi:putative transposase